MSAPPSTRHRPAVPVHLRCRCRADRGGRIFRVPAAASELAGCHEPRGDRRAPGAGVAGRARAERSSADAAQRRRGLRKPVRGLPRRGRGRRAQGRRQEGVGPRASRRDTTRWSSMQPRATRACRPRAAAQTWIRRKWRAQWPGWPIRVGRASRSPSGPSRRRGCSRRSFRWRFSRLCC